MAEEEGREPGCCRRHPVACGVTLLLVGVLGLAVVGVALGVHPTLKSMFKKTVNEVGGGDTRGPGKERELHKLLKVYCTNSWDCMDTVSAETTNKGSISMNGCLFFSM